MTSYSKMTPTPFFLIFSPSFLIDVVFWSFIILANNKVAVFTNFRVRNRTRRHWKNIDYVILREEEYSSVQRLSHRYTFKGDLGIIWDHILRKHKNGSILVNIGKNNSDTSGQQSSTRLFKFLFRETRGLCFHSSIWLWYMPMVS